MKSISTLFRQLSLIVVLISAFSLSALSAVYEKVTTAPADWSGDYLIVYGDGNVAFDGNLTTLDATSNTVSVTITDNKIEATEAMKAAQFTINASGHIKSASGYYIGQTSNANGLKSNTSTTYTNTLSLNADGTVNIVSGGAYLRYNATSGQYRFRYYKSSSYKSQKAIQLYKLVEEQGGGDDPETPCTDPTISFTETTVTKTNGEAPFRNELNKGGSTGDVTYTTENENIATVNATTGNVTIVGVGTTNIIATVNADDTYCEATAEYTLTVEGRTFDITWKNGAEIHTTTTYTEGGTLEFPVAPTPSEACQNAGWEFAGWSTSEITEDATSATLLTGTYTPIGDITLYAVYKLEETSSTGSAEAWALTDIANISATDEVVITMTYTDGTIYALSSSNGTSSAPTATTLTASNNNLSEAPTDDLVWNISKNDSSYTIYPNGTTETWLYCTSTNNGVRVGTNENKTFTIDAKSGYLKHTATGRYLGVYRTNPDWRCYDNTTGNTANQTLGFYVNQTTITYNSNPKCAVKEQLATPSLISSNISKHGFTISWNAIDNADSYTIKIDNEITTTIETFYTATELSANTAYTCSVTATDSQDNYYASEEATINVTTLPLDKYTITWNTNGEIETTEYEEESTLELPTPTIESTDYCNFAGWYTEQTPGSNLNPSQAPIGEKVTSATKPTGNVTYYAVYDNSKPEEKVTSNLTDGTYYIRTEDGIYYTGKVSEEKYGGYSSNVADAAEITVTTSESNFAIFDGTYWLYSPANNNEIEFSDELKTDWTLTNEGKINSINQTARYLQYNATSPRFACYKGTQKDAFLYKKGTEATAYFSTIEEEFIINNDITTIEHNTHVNSLTLHVDKTPNTQLKVTETITADTVTIIQTIDSTRWFFFSLPFDCNISDIVATYVNGGAELEYAPDESTGDYVIAKYDGDSSWVELTGTSHTLNANQGYIIGHFGSGDVTVKFPSADAQVISAPANATLEKTSDNDFNLIGLPYFQKVTNAGLNATYVSIPNKDGMTYTQEVYAEIIDSIAPFTSFFVQTEAENIEFTLGAQQNAAPMLRANGVTNKAVISLTDANGGADKTTIINNPSKTTDYEIGHDLTKLIGYAEIPQIYSLQGDEMLAFNSFAIDNSTVIPLGVYAHADGDYIFSLSKKSIGNLEGWELYDNETGKTTRLANEDLTIYLEQGTHEGRFEIRLQQRITTDCDNAMGDMTTWTANGTLNINNLPADAVVYIYDAVGRMVYVANNNSTTFNYTFAARGVYNIVVRSADNTVSFKTIY